MNDVSRTDGRTVIFVSHNMSAIQSLCSRSIYLSSGQIKYSGLTNDVISFYKDDISNFKFSVDTGLSDTRHRRGNGRCRFSKIEVKNRNGEIVQNIEYGESIIVELEFKVAEDIDELAALVALRSGRTHEFISDYFEKLPFRNLKAGNTYKFSFIIDSPTIRPGEYLLYFWLGDMFLRPYDVVDGILPPITVYSTKSHSELGFDPSSFTGYFSLAAKITT